MAPMELPIKPRWIVGVIAILIVAALMYAETIQPVVGMPVIIAVLGALGLYHRARPGGGGG